MSNRTHRDASGKRIRRTTAGCSRIGTGRPLIYKGRLLPDADTAAESSLMGNLPDAKPARCDQQAFEFADEPFPSQRKLKLPAASEWVEQLKGIKLRERERARLAASCDSKASPSAGLPADLMPAPRVEMLPIPWADTCIEVSDSN